MFGWLELLLIGGVIMVFAGPAGIKKVISTAQSVRKAKSQLTGRAAIEKLISEEPAPKPADSDQTSKT